MKNLCPVILLVCLIVLSGQYSFAEKSESGSDASNPYANRYPFDSVIIKYEGDAVYNYQSEDKQTYEWTETLYIKGGAMARETKGVTPGREVNNLQVIDQEFAYVINLTNKQGIKIDNASKYGKKEFEKLSADGKAAFRKHMAEKGVVSVDLPPVGKKVGTEKVLGRVCDVYETGVKPTEENIKLAVEKGEPLPEPIDFTSLRRGDLVFWRGHVAIMVDAERMIHANAHHMQVAVERLDIAMSRIARSDAGHVTSIKRFT